MDVCVICNTSLTNGQKTVVLREKGSCGINKASALRKDNIITKPGQSVHLDCRQQYCNKNVIVKDLKKECKLNDSSISHPTLRSEQPVFQFSEHCLFCANSAKISGKKRGYDVFPVRTSDFQRTVRQICIDRGDDWSQKVISRIDFANDLHAADAVYHQVCNINFRTGKQIPLSFQPHDASSPGRPKDNLREITFLKVMDYLSENDNEQNTVSDLVQKMKEFGCSDPYSVKYMRKKIEEHFGKDVIITNINGKSSVVTFKKTASAVLTEFYDSPKQNDSEEEKLRMVRTVANLIKNDIKSLDTSKQTYPNSEDISCADSNILMLPDSLYRLLRTMFTEKNADIKIASIGQAIIQATRPRVILAPLQIGLAVQMHHQFASKFLIDTLHSQGFCASYSEVKRFEVCAAKTQGTDIPGLQAGHFVQYIADNADHNVNTIDGYNTFHGMGIIVAITPGIKGKLHISRDVASNEEIAELGKIDIKFFKSSPLANLPLTYHDLGDLSCDDPTWKMDLLWKVVWPLRSPRPGWTGLMQTVAKGKYPGKSSIAYMPMMDMKATDMSCVFSTLHFVCKQARAQNVTPILTFDQPLWWKAQIIIQNEPSNSELKNIVLRLGGFHTEMSYLGCIGHIMRGSGLQELMEVVYAPNTVMHMLSGKALSRAVRGHFLVNSALNALLVQKAFSSHHTVSKQDLTSEADAEQMCQSDEIATTESATQHPSLDQEESHTEELDCDLGKTLSLFDQLLHDEASCDDICQDEALNRVHIKLQDQMSALSSSRTATLWLQYMEMVDLLRIFIKSERTGHWLLHLCTLRRMLPFFAATGHNLYAKSVHIYLQEMLHLEERHPEVYAMFESGFHVIRRSDRFWAGLSSDLVIEQTLMRNMKTSGGLTRGRGMSDSQRTQWLFSMPACADINDAMQEFTGTSYVTSDQHKDMTIARQKRDDNDTYKLLAFLQERDPFTSDKPLHNITTGVTAGNTVNADRGLEVGNSILKSMVGKQVFEHSFKKKDQVITMDNKSSVKIDGDVINVDSQLLFQRLVTAAQRNTEDISGIFEYELSTLPSSLFEPSGVLRAANKPALADALWKAGTGSEVLLPQDETMVHVLDGGSLLHKIPWPRNVTFSAILKMYIDYVSQKFPNPIIVFDGYDTGPSTKDVAHMKRSKGMIAPEVIFVEDMPIATRKDHFLANPSNKQRFINMFSKKLEEKNYKTVHAGGDADLLIVQTAVESASSRPTTVIGEDTDLLVLLCFHAEPTSLGLFFKSEGKTMIKKQRIWNITQLKVNLGSDICNYLPFVHAVGGCDTTSRLFGIGKGVVLKKLLNDSYFRQKVHLFCTDQTRENIMTAGEAIIVCLYNGLPGESLDSLRYRRFSEKVATSSSYVQVHSLPPTSAAARYHNARVYLQIKEWMGTSLDPEDWGWIKTGDKLEPRTTDKPPAPDTLLRVIRCNCKTECDSRRCICRRHGLECSVACGQCRGVACSNAMCILTDVVNGDN